MKSGQVRISPRFKEKKDTQFLFQGVTAKGNQSLVSYQKEEKAWGERGPMQILKTLAPQYGLPGVLMRNLHEAVRELRCCMGAVICREVVEKKQVQKSAPKQKQSPAKWMEMIINNISTPYCELTSVYALSSMFFIHYLIYIQEGWPAHQRNAMRVQSQNSRESQEKQNHGVSARNHRKALLAAKSKPLDKQILILS